MIANLDTLSPDQLREAVRTLMADVASKSAEIAFKQATIDKLAHEMAVLKRLKFAAKSETFNAEQKSLIEQTIDTDLAALALEIEQRTPSKDSGTAQRVGSVQLHQGRADPVADTAGRADRGIAAASLAGEHLALSRPNFAGCVARALTLRRAGLSIKEAARRAHVDEESWSR